MTRGLPDDEAPPTRLERWKSRYDLVSDIFSPKRLALLAAVLVLGIVGLVGGWDKVDAAERALPTAAPGEVVHTRVVDVAVVRARQGDAIEGLLRKEDGVRYVFVVARITVTGDRPITGDIIKQLLTIDVPGLATYPSKVDPSGRAVTPPELSRTSDALPAITLQPSLTYDVAFVWKQDAAERVAEQLTATIHDHTWRRSSLDGSMGWRDATPLTTVTVEVAQVRS